MQKITPFLWFDTQAEDAMNFYVSIFKNSKVGSVTKMGDGGAVMSVNFHLDGQEFIGINAGPQFKFSEAVSFYINCETQEEVDELWGKLVEGGEEGQCGWLKDKFGLSWQVIPAILSELLQDEDPQKSQRVMQAMLQMKKIDVQGLKDAHGQE